MREPGRNAEQKGAGEKRRAGWEVAVDKGKELDGSGSGDAVAYVVSDTQAILPFGELTLAFFCA